MSLIDPSNADFCALALTFVLILFSPVRVSFFKDKSPYKIFIELITFFIFLGRFSGLTSKVYPLVVVALLENSKQVYSQLNKSPFWVRGTHFNKSPFFHGNLIPLGWSVRLTRFGFGGFLSVYYSLLAIVQYSLSQMVSEKKKDKNHKVGKWEGITCGVLY